MGEWLQHRLASIVLTPIAICIGSFAFAQTTDGRVPPKVLSTKLEGTLESKFIADFADGKLSICRLQFEYMGRDFVYKQGAHFLVSGSVGLASSGTGLGTVLKIVLNDLDGISLAPMPHAPPIAYFVSGNRSTKDSIVTAAPSDTPGGVFVVMKFEDTLEVILDGLQKNRINIGFPRQRGRSDLQIEIDPRVTKTMQDGSRHTSLEEVAKFVDCMQVLIEGISKR